MLKLRISLRSKLRNDFRRTVLWSFVLALGFTLTASAQTTELPSAVNSVPYRFELHVRAVTPISATMAGGALPGGLTLSASGLISGAPAIAHQQDFNFRVSVTDSSEPPQTLKLDYRIRGFSDPAAAASQLTTRFSTGGNSVLDPRKFVSIYEHTKDDRSIKIYDPRQDSGSHLSVDAESSLEIVPEGDLLAKSDLAFNKLFMSAILASGDKQQNLEVEGYSMIGEDKATAKAQNAMAFQTAGEVQNTLLNMVYTSVGILKYAYGIDEKAPILSDASQAKINTPTLAADAIRTRAKLRFVFYKPEIDSISAFFTSEQNLSLVQLLGSEIFWVDSTSLQNIAKQYQEDLRVALDSGSQQTAKDQAIDQLLDRTKLVVDDFRDLLLQVEEQENKGPCAIPTTTVSPTEREQSLARECAIEKVAAKMRSDVVQGLLKKLAPGSISLRAGKAADGDLLTLKLEAVGIDGTATGISAPFEIDIKKYGAKIQLSPSMLFVHRNGVTHAEAFPPAPTTPPAANTPTPINRVNFAPSPGVTFGIAYFKRGGTAQNKFLRAVGPGIGMNVTFMNFNDPSYNLATNQFVNTTGTNVQVGAGLIGSLFDNKLQFSYGWNLNVDRRRNYVAVGFGFIEIGKELTKYIPK